MTPSAALELDVTAAPAAAPAATLEAAPPAARPPAPLAVRAASVVIIVGPFLGLLAAAALTWGWGFSWVDLGLLVGMYLVTGLGITVGFHRLFTHRAFETGTAMQVFLTVCGSMALQRPLLGWVATHRRHHQHSDTHDDPHSPHFAGDGVLGVLRGAWYAHMGWFFDADAPDLGHYVKDLVQNRAVRRTADLFLVWVALGLLIPAVLGGLLTGTWAGALQGFIWGGLVRLFLVHHVTWSVNSVCHIWGGREHHCHDESRNNALFGILALGEGWHNNHHAYPTSARHGLRWWQFDLSYLVIRGLELSGLVWKVKLPAKHAA